MVVDNLSTPLLVAESKEQDEEVAIYEEKDTEQNDEKLRGNDTTPSFVLSFQNLKVHVPKVTHHKCTKLVTPIHNFLHEYMGLSAERTHAFDVFSDLHGIVKSGEMCLVLGPSESGKSTLLRALCGGLNSGDELLGEIAINGIPLSTINIRKWRKNSVYVSSTDSEHSRVLTVKETFHFAAQCTSNSVEEHEIEKHVEEMLEMMNLNHASDMRVGDDSMQGVSAGEKRRVTVGEMQMNSYAKLICLDSITDGLASTEANMLMDKIAAMCKKKGIIGVASLLQPSDEIVGHFDKLLVLSRNGEMDYFGPVDRTLLQHCFMGSTDHFVDASICDIVLNEPIQDSLENTTSIPKHDSSALRYRASPTYQNLIDHLKGNASSSPSSTLDDFLSNTPKRSYFYQFKVIASRQSKLILRNVNFYIRPGIGILFGVLIGSLYSGVHNDLMGAFSRTGFMYVSAFLFLSLSSSATFPITARERLVLYKHRSAGFYSGFVAYLTRVLLDIPACILFPCIVVSICYYWVDLTPGFNHFSFFLAGAIGLEFVGAAISRLLSYSIHGQLSAKIFVVMLINSLGDVCGFFPTYDKLTWVLRWTSWLNPFAYAFELFMINQFHNQTMNALVVSDPDEGDTEIGVVSGDLWLSVFSLPRKEWGSINQIKALDVMMLFVFAFVYDIFGFFFSEYYRQYFYTQSRRSQPFVRHVTFKEDGDAFSVIDKKHEEQEQQNNDVKNYPQDLSVQNLKYSLSSKTNTRRAAKALFKPCLARCVGESLSPGEEDPNEKVLLHNVTACFLSGRITALVGENGAGKTTLMDVIAGYKTGGKITGDILIDGQPKQDSMWKKISGYSEQRDILNPYLSVFETLQFTAACRLSCPTIEQKSFIYEIIDLMGIEEYTNIMVGRENEGEGLSKHVRKRVTIANQLVVKPRILLLDDPTTGLGTSSAALVLGAIRRCTDALGLITIATIIQPSKQMFELCDDLLVLARGRVAYMGPIGQDSHLVLNYFAFLAGEEEEEEMHYFHNPADYILNVINKVSADVAVSAFENSSRYTALLSEIEKSKETSDKEALLDEVTGGIVSASQGGFWLLFKRHFLCQWRNPGYSFTPMLSSLFIGILLGTAFFQLITDDIAGSGNASGSISYLIQMVGVMMRVPTMPLFQDRAVFYRETASGMYSRLMYGIGQLFANICFHFFNTFLMFVPFYYLIGFRDGAEYVGYFFLMLFMTVWVFSSIGHLFSVLSPNEEVAFSLTGLTIALSVLTQGFFIVRDAMPSGWLWANTLNLNRYVVQGLSSNELDGRYYHIDIPITTVNNYLSVAGFPALDGSFASHAACLVSFMCQVQAGVIPKFDPTNLTSLVQSVGANGCMKQLLAEKNYSSDKPCNLKRHPCTDTDAMFWCFRPQIDHLNEFSTVFSHDVQGAVDIYSNQSATHRRSSSQLDIASCLYDAIVLNGSTEHNFKSNNEEIQSKYDIIRYFIDIIIDLIENGIDVSAAITLMYYGWAEFRDGDIVAPYKWDYCMIAVVTFLVGIELLKLFAIQFVNWTKR